MVDARIREPDLVDLLGRFPGSRFKSRQTEVEHLRLPLLIHEHVVRLEVAVENPRGVRSREPAPGLDVHSDQRAGPPLRLVSPLAQGRAAHVLHRDEHVVAERADVVDGDDVRVRHLRHRLRLAEEARARLSRGDAGRCLRAEHFDGDATFELAVEREIDDPHPAVPDVLQDDVPAERRAGDKLAARRRFPSARPLTVRQRSLGHVRELP